MCTNGLPGNTDGVLAPCNGTIPRRDANLGLTFDIPFSLSLKKQLSPVDGKVDRWTGLILEYPGSDGLVQRANDMGIGIFDTGTCLEGARKYDFGTNAR